MAAVQKGCEPYTAADYERGDDVGGCTFCGNSDGVCSVLNRAMKIFRKRGFLTSFGVKVSGVSGKLMSYDEKKETHGTVDFQVKAFAGKTVLTEQKGL